MLFLPKELLFNIFDNVKHKRDLLESQLVCRAFLEPARRVFYKLVVIQELQGLEHLNYNKSLRFKKFIDAMSQKTIHERIPLPGQYVKSLVIDFEIPLESQFMPTLTDFQALAKACPNIEILRFPTNMFWNSILSIDTQKYWKKVKKIDHHMNERHVSKFLHFKSSIVELNVDNWYMNPDQFTSVIQQFQRLERLKIRSIQCLTNLHDVIPTLVQCPNITELFMTCTSSINKTGNIIVPQLRNLELVLHERRPDHTINTVIQNFPDLKKLSLHFQNSRSWSDDSGLFSRIKNLIDFTAQLSQAYIDIHVTNYNVIHSLVQHFTSIHPSLNFTYNNCASYISGLPDISFKKSRDQNINRLYIRYQGFTAYEQDDLPHFLFLKEHGYYQSQLSIQEPLSYLRKEASQHKQQSAMSSSIQAILKFFCPNLKILSIKQGYFHLLDSDTTNSRLFHLTLKRSYITSNSLYYLSRQYAQLEYLTLKFCLDENEKPIHSIYMPFTNFKKLIIIDDKPESFYKSNHHSTYLISIIQENKKNLFQYQHKTVSEIQDSELLSNQSISLKIHCKSLHQLILNSHQIYMTYK